MVWYGAEIILNEIIFVEESDWSYETPLLYLFLTTSNWILQLAETYGMEFFETSASTSSNISEVGNGDASPKKLFVTLEMCTNTAGNSLLHSCFISMRLFFHLLLPLVFHSCGRTGVAGSQERCGHPVGISGWLPGEGRSGRREGCSGYQQRHSEDLRLLVNGLITVSGRLL